MLLIYFNLNSNSFFVTTSKAPVTRSVALVTSSFFVTTSKAPVTTSVALVTSSNMTLLQPMIRPFTPLSIMAVATQLGVARHHNLSGRATSCIV